MSCEEFLLFLDHNGILVSDGLAEINVKVIVQNYCQLTLGI